MEPFEREGVACTDWLCISSDDPGLGTEACDNRVNAFDAGSSTPTCLDKMSDCSSQAADTGSLLGTRVGGLFGILAVSVIGVFIPLIAAQSQRVTGAFFVVRALAAGVVLATGFVHVLGDAFPILTDPCLHLSTT